MMVIEILEGMIRDVKSGDINIASFDNESVSVSFAGGRTTSAYDMIFHCSHTPKEPDEDKIKRLEKALKDISEQVCATCEYSSVIKERVDSYEDSLGCSQFVSTVGLADFCSRWVEG